MIAGGWIKFVFFPPLEADLVNGTISYPDGSPIEMSMEGLSIIESSAQKLKNELEYEFPDEEIFVNILATAGDQPVKNKSTQGPGAGGSLATGSHFAEYAIELSPGENRSISATEIARSWRELTPTIIGAKEVAFTSELFSAGDPINIQLA